MSKQEDVVHAFPGKVCVGHAIGADGEEYVYQHPQGMTLRDYFAAKAIQGMWANAEVLKMTPSGGEAEWLSKCAYQQADSMLKARQS